MSSSEEVSSILYAILINLIRLLNQPKNVRQKVVFHSFFNAEAVGIRLKTFERNKLQSQLDKVLLNCTVHKGP